MISPEAVSVSLSTLVLISLAEIGDKSQLVCMTLAARHRPWPVIIGASVAFMVLNALAVIFGAGVAGWLPERVTAAGVALLFAAFGIHAIRSHEEQPEEAIETPGHSIFLTTLMLILVAEFGDKTQIAVAGLAGSMSPWPVYLGATAALITISVLGVWAGRTLFRYLPLVWLHRLGGGVFLLFAVFAAYRAITA
ncbi:MAG TPA: TMEM165/GDT1 family protein [Sedimenticola thiotaurini]|uniref:GDT1 family protein n=1 Tax=Sedimenticola thiotaurini TaxID=1543721 RepID=A0A831RNP5_9GAMM|nr:TMEM165/GDT1 family protein [Sedimenticola thiotaurini]